MPSVITATPLPDIGYLRLKQIIGDPKRGIPPIIPVSRATWWAGVKSGRYPAGVLLGGARNSPRAWSVESIRALLDSYRDAANQRGTAQLSS